jgi:hypothetical protein
MSDNAEPKAEGGGEAITIRVKDQVRAFLLFLV